MKRKIKAFLDNHVGTITFTEQKKFWFREEREIGKRHFYFSKSEFGCPTKTFCGINIKKKTRISDGWWGGYGWLFKSSKKNCRKCLKKLRIKISSMGAV